MKLYPRERTGRSCDTPASPLAVSAALAACLVAPLAGADTKKTTPAPAPAAKPVAQQPQLNSPFNLNGLKLNNNAPAAQQRTPLTSTPAATQRTVPGNPFQRPSTGAGNVAAPNRTAAANLANQHFTPGPPVVSHNFPGHPGPPGSTETQARNGSIVRKAPDGSVLDAHNPRTGVTVHHALDGSRQITVERPDHSRVYIPARGIQYVQKTYTYQGHPMVNRTMVVGGQLFHQIYRPFTYGKTTLDVYATSRYFAPGYYQWASSPFRGAQKFAWTYTTSGAAWYGHYRGYFTPEPVYQTPTAWLTDYLLAATLYVAYAAKDESGDPPPDNVAPITPQIKMALDNEVARQVSTEGMEAQQNANNTEPTAAAGSVVQTLSDHQMHAFLVASELDLVDATGRRCTMSEGDAVNVMASINADAGTVGAIVLSSKGGTECGRAAQVQLALTDVQEMQNHMREAVDQGLASTKAAEQAQSVTPAFAAAAPPADSNAPSEIKQQEAIAAAADG